MSKIWLSTGTELWRKAGGAWAELTPPGSLGSTRPLFGFSDTEMWWFDPSKAWRWNGSVWTGYSHGLAGGVYGAWGAASDDIWAIGPVSLPTRKTFHHWDGTEWTQDATSSVTMSCIYGVATDDIWAGGTTGDLYHWNGSAWALTDLGGTGSVQGMFATATDDFWCCDHEGSIFHYNGSSWSSSSHSVTNVNWQWIHGASSSDIWVVGKSSVSGLPMSAHWDGSAWTEVTASGSYEWRGAWVLSDTLAYAASGDLYVWDGDTWAVETTAPSGYLSLQGLQVFRGDGKMSLVGLGFLFGVDPRRGSRIGTDRKPS